ncbi:Hypothetical predicted protein [Octopus vulgaris]|uniref:Uncharacterized protein n=1 Tax=Octopus vulgaris TaxID=6645 RepID=A0AA36AKG1_OCTVU|nr:Hypothetical predicted protein [Octopus vulgaris]
MSVKADETTDSAMPAQVSIIIRYVYEDKTCEQFLGFYEAGKVFDILQCKLLDIKHGHSKLNDFIHCAKGYCKDEHYESILRDTAVVIEQADDSDPPEIHKLITKLPILK